MSSIIASSEPPPPVSMWFTGRGVLSSSVRPRDCASRRAGSMVRTTTLRPCSAAHRPSAAAVVVLPTPPAPQHTTIRVAGSRTRAATSKPFAARSGAVPGTSDQPLVGGGTGEQRDPTGLDALGQVRQPGHEPALRPHDLVQPALEVEPVAVLPGLGDQGRGHPVGD